MRWMGLALCLGLAACSTADDVGQTCPLDQLPDGDDAQSADFQEIIEVNTEFPCENLVCLASNKRSGYCSRECRKDEGCPDAFECRQIGDIGPFVGRTFCAWRACQVSFECGDVKTYRCDLDTNGDNGRCNFIDPP